MMNILSSGDSVFPDSKSHYKILDGLRGVAAITVVLFHILEIFSGGLHTEQIINHGYLAVDFFFVLSGFVVGHAYDDRWNKMTVGEFLKRRLIRLHPMIIAGMIIGAACFYFSASPILFPGISQIPVWKLLLVMVIGFTLIPVPTSLDIRGWQEMHPLNGPAWTLFFEYIGNLLYAFVLRKLSNKMLAVLVFVAGCALIQMAVTSTNGDVIGGWSLELAQLRIGFTRFLYPFLAGLLLSRIFKPGFIKNSFIYCSILIIFILSFPRIGGTSHLWLNGLYDSLSIIILFPIIVYMGASDMLKGKNSEALCQFLGNISYPIYIVHYPLIYIYSAWVVDKKIPLSNGWPMGLLLLSGAIMLAYASFKLYDLPLRKWLSQKFMR